MVVVVAEHRHYGHADVAQLGADDGGLGRVAAAGEVAGQQEKVGVVGHAGDVGAKVTDAVNTEVDVADRRDSDHRSSS